MEETWHSAKEFLGLNYEAPLGIKDNLKETFEVVPIVRDKIKNFFR